LYCGKDRPNWEKAMGKNRLLTILQWVFGIYFISTGIMHFALPEGLPSMMSWMYELDDNLHLISGTAEILGGLGLILPAVTGIRTELIWMAAAGLTLVMVGAVIWHIGRGETQQVIQDAFVAAVLAYLAIQRRNNPVPSRNSGPEGQPAV
jgi:uncharacterized membrane protein